MINYSNEVVDYLNDGRQSEMIMWKCHRDIARRIWGSMDALGYCL